MKPEARSIDNTLLYLWQVLVVNVVTYGFTDTGMLISNLDLFLQPSLRFSLVKHRLDGNNFIGNQFRMPEEGGGIGKKEGDRIRPTEVQLTINQRAK